MDANYYVAGKNKCGFGVVQSGCNRGFLVLLDVFRRDFLVQLNTFSFFIKLIISKKRNLFLSCCFIETKSVIVKT